MGFVRERPGTNGGVRYQALYDDVKGHRRSAGTFVAEAEAVRAWQRAEDRQADGRSSDTRRTRQRFRRYVEDVWFYPCRGVKTPPVAKELRTITTPDQFDQL